MRECVLTARVYFDLFNVLKNKDCQFSCTDGNMSMDPLGAESKADMVPGFPRNVVMVVVGQRQQSLTLYSL